jgi:hypothetical protein
MKVNDEPRKGEKRGKGGRSPKDDPATKCVMVRFNEAEYARFLSLYEQSGVYAKAVFIKARVFNEPFRTVKTDRAAMEFVARLTSFYAQFRSVGVNYNQVVKELHSRFSEKKTLALLYKLENLTRELVGIAEQILKLSKQLEENKS